ncbi:hypothetical protein AYI68_g4240 [Smittium mucronatum]|uniref:V-type ATPase assembly factor PKR1 n=1 Tax=Smittium mucronatum TaxID=133383 RepID=A0A1R0GTS9_9FUNG|nr:hypothetical protein AYI68_g5626 [Smittium mucronatum]OLY81649.1 hypothetical protein AYI68_g4240 [Smittium mucronatum]
MSTTDNPAPTSTMGDVIDSIFSGGVNQGVMKVLNLTFMALFLVLLTLLYLTGPNIYLVSVMVINAFLFTMIQYLVSEYLKDKKAKDQNKQPTNSETDKPKKTRKRI